MIGAALFVYGTLKSGHPNNYLLNSQRYLGVAKTQPKYQMYRYSSYPALIKSSDANFGILGELYEVHDNCFNFLDEFEGTSSGLFKRDFIELDNFNLSFLPVYQNSYNSIFEEKKAFAYFFIDKEKLSGIKLCGVNWTL